MYEAVKAGIKMTDGASYEADAIRAVVVLTDGQANEGGTKLDDLIRMMSSSELDIVQFRGFEDDSWARDEDGRQVAKEELSGTGLTVDTRYPVQIFFIGIGDDADLQVGRLLAEATGAEFQGVTEKDLANVLEEFSKYF